MLKIKKREPKDCLVSLKIPRTLLVMLDDQAESISCSRSAVMRTALIDWCRAKAQETPSSMNGVQA